MLKVRRSNERGDANHGWLKSKHTFSFADYYDEKNMGFGALRVINEDRIDGGTGFGTHGHRDMEIISYVIEGALEHKDSMGTNTVIKPGEVQRMSAGTGIRHSEMNHLKDKTTHFLQIWILPEMAGIEPSYDQRSFDSDFACSDLILVASRDGRNNSVLVHQDVDMYAAKAQDKGEKLIETFPHRYLWVQVIKGSVNLTGLLTGSPAAHLTSSVSANAAASVIAINEEKASLESGDGAGLSGIKNLKLEWSEGSEFILFDLPK